MADKKATLYLNMILGDFEDPEIVKRSIDSVKDAVDGMYITITHKEDEPQKVEKLVKLLEKYKAHISFYKWTYNFANARQFALDQVPKGENVYIYWQDADDVLRGAEHLHRIADEMILYQEAAVYFTYWYQVELDEKGEVKEILVEHKRERIIRHDDTWKWIGELHETLIEQKQENIIRHLRKECWVIHLTNNQRLDHNIDRNIEILEETAKAQQHKDPRTLIYLAKAYYDKAKINAANGDDTKKKINLDLALNLFHEYLAGSGTPGKEGYQEASGWPEERSTAWAYIAEIAVISGHPEVAIGAYQNAIDEAPQFPEYYIDMAMCYVMLDNFKKAEHWLNVGTSVPEPETTIIQFPRERKTRSLEASFHINMHKQRLDWALQDARKLLEIIPNDKLAQDRVKAAESLVAYNKACQSFVFIGKYLEQTKQQEKIQHLLNAMPAEMHQEQWAAQMKHLFQPPKIWADDEIAIVCGPGFEKWDANSINTGLGGSEEAVVYLSQELKKLGWKVTVYGNPERPGNFDGVEYKVWHDLNPKDEFAVLILWRAIGFVDVKPKAKFTMLWLHDVPNNPDFTEERMQYIDKVAVLSEYHKSLLRIHKRGMFYPMPAEKVFLTSNGIPELPHEEWKGNPHRMIYSSSFDRGVVYLLQNWGKVRKAVPEAELHLFYGWEVYDAIHRDNPQRKQWKDSVMTLMKQDGIVYHGRVGHNALHAEMAKSGVWAYPTDFTEISCITAMKAQALGAIPVVTDFAALQETVRNGVKVDVDITTEEGQTEYIDALIDLLKDEDKQKDIRKGMMKWARNYFSWSNVAKLWDERFKVGVLESVAKKYYAAEEPETKVKTDKADLASGQRRPVSAIHRSTTGQEQGQGSANPAEGHGSNGNAG